MEVDDPDLYAARDSRTLVMDSVLADLDFACEHITLTSDQTSSLITKYVAQAFKSRVCLFEGTFRKYHTEYGLKESANAWLNEAVKAAEDVIANSGFKLYTANGTTKSYRDLFISVKPVTTEVMLAAVCDKSLSVLNDANWYWILEGRDRFIANGYKLTDSKELENVMDEYQSESSTVMKFC